jgi:Tol biopolymer transport system component
VGACLAALMLAAPSADAAFPGANGRIAFESTRDDIDPTGCIFRFPTCDWEIWVMNADGSGQTRLTSPPGLNGGATWSPDGARIAFVSLRDGNSDIYVMNADGTGQTRLTISPAADGSPSWSPDGIKIAFISTRDNSDGEIYVMNADGTGVTRLTDNGATEREAAWSPDGRKIAFQRQVCDIDFGCAGDIFTIDVGGTAETNLTNTPREHDELPEWSPDGSTIAYFKDFETVYLINRDGTGVRPMPGAAPGDSAPAWSPDGKQVAVGANEYQDVVVVNLADGTRQTLTPSGAFDASPDWQPITQPVGPQRGDYDNAAQFCKAERSFLGDAAFATRYGTSRNGVNAFGKCVSRK